MKLSVSFLVFLTLSYFHNSATADDALIRKVCENETPCVDLLKSDPRSETADEIGLAKIALVKFSDTASSALDLLKNVTTCTASFRRSALLRPAAVVDDLPNCEMRFEDTVSIVPSMAAAVDLRDVSSVLLDLDYLRATTEQCSEELSEHKCREYLALADKNQIWETEIGIVYSLVQKLPK